MIDSVAHSYRTARHVQPPVKSAVILNLPFAKTSNFSSLRPHRRPGQTLRQADVIFWSKLRCKRGAVAAVLVHAQSRHNDCNECACEMLNLTFSDRSLAKNGAGRRSPDRRPNDGKIKGREVRGGGPQLTQEESTRYELSAINFHLEETSPRERKGNGRLMPFERFDHDINQ